jgi:hypothetical protein
MHRQTTCFRAFASIDAAKSPTDGQKPQTLCERGGAVGSQSPTDKFNKHASRDSQFAEQTHPRL